MTNRWPSIIFRLLPFIALKLNLSMATLAKLFSISFPLYHIIVFSICHWVYRDKVFSMLVLFTVLLGCSETFYWCSSDLLQGILTVLLAFVVYKNSKKLLFKYALSAFFIVAAVFFHPLVLFPFFYMIKDDVLENKKLSKEIIFLPIVFVITWLVRNQFFTTWYDAAKSKEFWENLSSRNWFDLYAHEVFIVEIPFFYQTIFFLLIVNLFIFFKYRNWLRAIFLMASFLVFILVVHLGNPEGIRMFYRESSYTCLSVFVTYPFLKHIYISERVQSKYLLIIPLILMICFTRITLSSTAYTQRINWLNNKLAFAKCEKSVVPAYVRLKGTLKMEWAIPFESALLAAERNEYKTVFYTKNSQDYIKKENPSAFLGPFKTLNTDDFNPKYFQFKKSHYCLNPKR